MAFSTVSWTNGDTMTEAKLDQMVENETLAYHAAEAVQIYAADQISLDVVGISTLRWGLFIDGVQIGADMATLGSENVLADLGPLSSSGIGTGIHEVEIRYDTTAVGGKYKFYVSDSHNYLTVWLTPTRSNVGSLYTHTASNITVIMHITQKTWT